MANMKWDWSASSGDASRHDRKQQDVAEVPAPSSTCRWSTSLRCAYAAYPPILHTNTNVYLCVVFIWTDGPIRKELDPPVPLESYLTDCLLLVAALDISQPPANDQRPWSSTSLRRWRCRPTILLMSFWLTPKLGALKSKRRNDVISRNPSYVMDGP